MLSMAARGNVAKHRQECGNGQRRLCFGTIFQLIGIVAGFLRRAGMLTKNSRAFARVSTWHVDVAP